MVSSRIKASSIRRGWAGDHLIRSMLVGPRRGIGVSKVRESVLGPFLGRSVLAKPWRSSGVSKVSSMVRTSGICKGWRNR